MRSYTSDELEQATGFDRRTIAYYVQEGLLPKVGRRGPRTRYPKLVRDRLLFIRRVREAEESGGVSPVSLSVMREIFERIPPELIASVADGQTLVTESIVSMALVEARPPARRREAIRARLAVLQEAARRRLKRASSSMDAWSRIEITPEIALSVRGASDEDAGLLEKVGDQLRQLILRRPKQRR